MKARRGLAGLLAGLLLTGCQEKLGTPTDCPELCPGTSLTIRDTVLIAKVGLDSTFTGYQRADQVGALLVSSGLAAGEARSFAVFPARSDTVFVDATPQSYTVDSVAFVVQLIARDTAVHNLRLVLHRVAVTVDTSTSFADLDAQLTPASLIDSVLVSDTLKSGAINIIVKGAALSRLVPFDGDSGKLAIGIRVSAPAATGVRLGAVGSSVSPPLFTTYAKANVADTAKQRSVITLNANLSNYAIDQPPIADPRDLFLGGRSGSRTLLRFELPKLLKDSAAVVRATLELTPRGPIKGLPNDPGELQVRGVLVDLGAKSLAISTVSAVAALAAGATAVQSIDLRDVVTTWLGPNGTPASVLLGLAPEGGTFARPEFFSTESGAFAPRLRITYALPTHPGHP